jgi:hypothetical protein
MNKTGESGVYARLGVRRVIHGAGTTTRYGGSLMRPAPPSPGCWARRRRW